MRTLMVIFILACSNLAYALSFICVDLDKTAVVNNTIGKDDFSVMQATKAIDQKRKIYDVCKTNTILMEAVCIKGEATNRIFDCKTIGKVCSAGACNQGSAQNDCDPNGDGFINDAIADQNFLKFILVGLEKESSDQLSIEEALNVKVIEQTADNAQYAPDVKTLSGLACFKNLETFEFGWSGYNVDNDVKDVSALSQMTKLKEIRLGDMPNIDNLAFLSGLTQLEYIDLAKWKNLTDITALGKLPNLKSVRLLQFKAPNLAPLAGTTKLEHLFIGAKNVTDISVVSNMVSLKLIGIDESSVTDLSPLEKLPLLHIVTLYQKAVEFPVSALSPLVNNAGFGEDDKLFLRTGMVFDEADLAALKNKGVNIAWMP